MQTVASIQTPTKPAAQIPAYPNGLRPEFDAWSVGQKKVFSVKWDGKGRYEMRDTEGTVFRLSANTLLNNLLTGFFATLPVNHDQQ
jgi:hypothetical protein